MDAPKGIVEEDLDAKAADDLPKNLDMIFAGEALPAADVCKDASYTDDGIPDATCLEAALKVLDSDKVELCDSLFSHPEKLADSANVEFSCQEKLADSANMELSDSVSPCPEKASADGTRPWFLRPSVGTWLLTQTPLLQPEERYEKEAKDATSLDMVSFLTEKEELVDTAAVDPEAAATEANCLAEKEFVDTAAVAPEAVANEASFLAAKGDFVETATVAEEAAATEAAPEPKVVSDFEEAQIVSPIDSGIVHESEEGDAVKKTITGLEDLALHEDSEEFGVVKDAHSGM